ncbi:MAG: tRNA preQ1(34) S-adenosylmethionine ribosyltransferase-isomerase QueA [Deltaproteobacteria bacterium]|nr:tRNA preQ1(34) S-adenosylmethionine ribosyltransferase-isomerase QueA [Deltaproteobacteria bacterium]MBI3388409.1 tRNA preQ1(34) S-adenosylmethionine ribosyltransferase-isomerase QueA [Deltaproteobacteria bacterium]
MQSAVHIAGAEPSRLSLGDFQFDLPPELIAQEPAVGRSQARLLVWDRGSAARTHTHVADLARFVRPGDVFVFNDTKVIPARLYGRTSAGAAVELLVIWRRSPHPSPLPEGEGAEWECLGRPSKRLRPGVELRFADAASAVVCAAHGDGRYDVTFDTDDVLALLAAHGEVPLPPYIKRPDGPLPFDRERYQTVYASQPGAIAAPTAGLHFTPALLNGLRAVGAATVFVTLHVGPGTFLPVRGDDLNDHVMDAEWCEIPEATAARITETRRDGRRIVAVGTTTTRALESSVDAAGTLRAGARWADQFIRPGHRFRVIDALFTNFHLPGSTLLALVSAFAGREQTLAVYEDAVRQRYRFYSYGDAMLIQ